MDLNQAMCPQPSIDQATANRHYEERLRQQTSMVHNSEAGEPVVVVAGWLSCPLYSLYCTSSGPLFELEVGPVVFVLPIDFV